ncbi:MAG: hypothetical protein U0V87_06700 [Acidobacteriota bacterium]
MRQLKDNLWVFWASTTAGTIDRNGFYLLADDARLVINPPGIADEDVSTFQHLGPPTHVVLTDADRHTGAAQFAERFGSRVWLPQSVAIDIPGAHRYSINESLPAGLHAISLPAPRDAGEVVLHDRGHSALMLGASFAAVPPGKVGPGAEVGHAAHRQNLQAVGEINFELLLPANGFTLHREGRRAIASSLM